MTIAKCPVCGDELIRKKYKNDDKENEFISHKNWVSDGTQCTYKTPFVKFMGIELTDEQLKELIENGQTKKPVAIKAILKLEDGRILIDYSYFKK